MSRKKAKRAYTPLDKKFEKTRYTYRIDARLDEGDKWQPFTGSLHSDKSILPAFFRDHINGYFRDMPYEYSLKKYVRDIYTALCPLDKLCGHKSAGCVKPLYRQRIRYSMRINFNKVGGLI